MRINLRRFTIIAGRHGHKDGVWPDFVYTFHHWPIFTHGGGIYHLAWGYWLVTAFRLSS